MSVCSPTAKENKYNKRKTKRKPQPVAKTPVSQRRLLKQRGTSGVSGLKVATCTLEVYIYAGPPCPGEHAVCIPEFTSPENKSGGRVVKTSTNSSS